uniref:Uncharacterized protein n=1 Tax=Anguilla anguilla TaxID=7936 RepID=A0A0E9QRX7_ANGAN
MQKARDVEQKKEEIKDK